MNVNLESLSTLTLTLRTYLLQMYRAQERRRPCAVSHVLK